MINEGPIFDLINSVGVEKYNSFANAFESRGFGAIAESDMSTGDQMLCFMKYMTEQVGDIKPEDYKDSNEFAMNVIGKKFSKSDPKTSMGLAYYTKGITVLNCMISGDRHYEYEQEILNDVFMNGLNPNGHMSHFILLGIALGDVEIFRRLFSLGVIEELLLEHSERLAEAFTQSAKSVNVKPKIPFDMSEVENISSVEGLDALMNKVVNNNSNCFQYRSTFDIKGPIHYKIPVEVFKLLEQANMIYTIEFVSLCLVFNHEDTEFVNYCVENYEPMISRPLMSYFTKFNVVITDDKVGVRSASDDEINYLHLLAVLKNVPYEDLM